jgi:hypothetical protein
VEGTLTLLSATLPAEVRANLNRVALPDPRNLAGSYFAGDPIPGIPSDKIYNWELGYAWGAKLKLTELSGHLDAVARIRILFFKKTFRHQFAKWDGFGPQEFVLIGGSGGAPLNASSDYGKFAERIAHTGIPLLTPADVPAAPDPSLVYPDKLGEECPPPPPL